MRHIKGTLENDWSKKSRFELKKNRHVNYCLFVCFWIVKDFVSAR